MFLKSAAAPWPAGEDFRSSAKAEPRGVKEAVYFFRDSLENTKNTCILTDHESLVWASGAMFTHSYHYNGVFIFLDKMKKNLGGEFHLYFLQGIHNTADSLSRGRGVESTSFPLFAGRGWELRLSALGNFSQLAFLC